MVFEPNQQNNDSLQNEAEKGGLLVLLFIIQFLNQFLYGNKSV